MDELKLSGKPFDISKAEVWQAWEKVKENKGAPGVDGCSIADFETDLKNNLYKVWNRMSSGSYFPPPVRAVEIPKKAGGTRTLGVPTVADRVAQTVVRLYLEPEVEPSFHPDSYAYRPGRSALDAVATCRQRAWKMDWVIDLDIRAFFDSLPHDLLLMAVSKHTHLRWIRLYVERWLVAPLQREDGTLVARDRGTPQGSAISPLLANLFLHYAFDMWLTRHFPAVRFERYADDAVIHCATEAQARRVLDAIRQRLAQVGLELHPDKTRIVRCKEDGRHGTHPVGRFDFLGFTFRRRVVRGPRGLFEGFVPAISDDAAKAIRHTIRRWRLHLHSDRSLDDLARTVNPSVRGWIGYYGRFYRSELSKSLRRIDAYLVRWAMRKYRKLRYARRRAVAWLARVRRRVPTLFAHWAAGLQPSAG